MTLSFLPLTHQIIAVCVYSSRDHRSKIYLFYMDACYAPNRAPCATPVLYARPGLSPAALAYHAPHRPFVTDSLPISNPSAPTPRQEIHTHTHTLILPHPHTHPHPHAPPHTHTHTITHARAPTGTIARSSITHRCPSTTPHPSKHQHPVSNPTHTPCQRHRATSRTACQNDTNPLVSIPP